MLHLNKTKLDVSLIVNFILLTLLMEMTIQSNTIKNTVICLPELQSARSPCITKMLSTMSNLTHVKPGELLKNFWLLHPNGRLITPYFFLRQMVKT